MDQLRNALQGPHATSVVVLWAVAAVAVGIAAAHAARRRPDREGWSRIAAVGFPLAVAAGLLLASVVGAFTDTWFAVGMWLRLASFWTAAVLAPTAVGQALGLEAPAWTRRVLTIVGALFLLGTLVSDLVMLRQDAYDPTVQFGPLATVLLLPAVVVLVWWLFSCFTALRGTALPLLFALGASVTVLALLALSLVLDPVLADHFLAVGFLPLLGTTELLTLGQRRTPAVRTSAT